KNVNSTEAPAPVANAATPPPPSRSVARLDEEGVDANLAELAVELEAPVHHMPVGQSNNMAPPIPEGRLNPGRTTRPAPPGKRKRRERGGLPPAWIVDISEVDFGQLHEQDRLDKLSVKQLKTFLYQKEEGLAGVKSVLVDRVKEVLSREGLRVSGEPKANGLGRADASKGTGDDETELSLFTNQDASDGNARDDMFIDEVFSAM
ncbi:MAG: hypothetical protein SGPRY_008175, partial [Prymnesium sp.]